MAKPWHIKGEAFEGDGHILIEIRRDDLPQRLFISQWADHNTEADWELAIEIVQKLNSYAQLKRDLRQLTEANVLLDAELRKRTTSLRAQLGLPEAGAAGIEPAT